MPVYVALLRGINVGAHKRIKMDALRQTFEALKFQEVKTYIQSGNVVFKTAKVPAEKLAQRIEKQILSDFGFAASVVCRTFDEMRDAIEKNPFVKIPGIDPEKLHVSFLSAAPAAEGLAKLEKLTVAPERSCCVEKEVYLYLPNGTAESTLMKTPLDRTLSIIATTRNWRTVNTLRQMCQECG